MPLFRRKSEKLPKTSSLSLYGQGRVQTPPYIGEKASTKAPHQQFSPNERLQPFLAFAEVTFDPSIPLRYKSRLSKTLEKVLHDNAALAYFIQFMDFVKAQHIIKFWLEAESFHVSVTSRLQGFGDGETLRPAEPVPLYPLLSSDSSGCISERSDDNFHPSSQSKNCDPSHLVNAGKTNGRCISSDTGLDGTSISASQSSHNSYCSEASRSDSSSDTSQAITSVTEDIAHEKVLLKSYDDDSAISNKSHSDFGTSDTLHVNTDLSPEDPSIPIHIHKGDMVTNCISSDSSTRCVPDSDITESLSLESNQNDLKVVRLKTSVEQDAKALFEKYIARTAPSPLGISDEVRSQIGAHIFEKEGRIEPECFLSAQTFVLKRMEDEYFPVYLQSSFHNKYQIDVLTSGNVYLADVMYNDSALFYFMEFMEQENVRHLLDFLLMADNFQKHLLSQGTYDGDQAQNDSMIIYDKYFSLQASNPLGFSDSVRYEVEHNICREGGPLPDCFSMPVRILTQYLEKTYLLQFLNSQLYFKYISECIISIQTGGANCVPQPKYSGSESGSEHSLPVSSVNTLLAMDEKQPGTSSKVLKNIEEQDMRIDTGHFKPDSLWQRPLAGRLQMAHIDKLGRVITEFEPEPDRRRESRISKAMKKLVNRDDDKHHEDMAWQVAEMIVKDICSVTMPDSLDKMEESEAS